ncbi:hypothetical protein BpHYR1_048574 [Brachionus plicatilis]|uniref:Uncharacterized protein n=1 Tax=Brachionus plicatilis TaxID=10195 RepID=A0A3M7QXJ1_BRAPC|nr:hypothetical protein BpHYR1_048574 [Brachionus plicatilis]
MVFKNVNIWCHVVPVFLFTNSEERVYYNWNIRYQWNIFVTEMLVNFFSTLTISKCFSSLLFRNCQNQKCITKRKQATCINSNRDYLSYRKCTNYLNKQAHVKYQFTINGSKIKSLFSNSTESKFSKKP